MTQYASPLPGLALSGAVLVFFIGTGVLLPSRCPEKLSDGRRLVAVDIAAKLCKYEIPQPLISTLSPEELRRMARARERSTKIRSHP